MKKDDHHSETWTPFFCQPHLSDHYVLNFICPPTPSTRSVPCSCATQRRITLSLSYIRSAPCSCATQRRITLSHSYIRSAPCSCATQRRSTPSRHSSTALRRYDARCLTTAGTRSGSSPESLLFLPSLSPSLRLARRFAGGGGGGGGDGSDVGGGGYGGGGGVGGGGRETVVMALVVVLHALVGYWLCALHYTV